jgi:hypothetical protein
MVLLLELIKMKEVMVMCLDISFIHLTQERCEVIWKSVQTVVQTITMALHNILGGDHSSMSILVFISGIGAF